MHLTVFEQLNVKVECDIKQRKKTFKCLNIVCGLIVFLETQKSSSNQYSLRSSVGRSAGFGTGHRFKNRKVVS